MARLFWVEYAVINPGKAGCFFALCLIAFVPLAPAQGTYTQIDFPGSTGTYCWGIDNAEEISGTFGDSGGGYHGFLLSGGNFSVIDYPGAQNTYLNGLNDLGQIVGFARSPDIGFVYDVQTQSFTEIRYPGAPLTYPYSINNAGTIVGAFTDSHMRKLRGFELIDQTL